jgi:hypothetical protein
MMPRKLPTNNDAVLPLNDFLAKNRPIMMETLYDRFDEKLGSKN